MKYEKKVAVIGLGSMGKRRIRNLKALGFEKIYGFDLREDRKLSSKQQYGIQVISSIEDLISEKFDALIISTPPDTHHIYMKIAIDYRIPAFIEASVLDTDFNDIIRLSEKYKCLTHSYIAKVEGPLDEMIERVETGNSSSTYHCENIPEIVITLLHTDKKGPHVYQNKGKIINALETFETIVTFKEEFFF